MSPLLARRTPESFSKVLSTFKKYKACAVLRTPKAELAPPAMTAAIDGGFEIVEFTLTTPGCLDAVADFRAKYDGKVMVGCGTVMDIPDAKAAMDAGAEFLVAPVLVPEVVTWCALHNIVIIPGCQTPTEAYNAYKAGAPVQVSAVPQADPPRAIGPRAPICASCDARSSDHACAARVRPRRKSSRASLAAPRG